MCSMLGARCSRWKSFFDGAAETTSTRRQSHSSLGPWGDRGSVYRSVPVPAPQYVHLQIHDRSPKQRFRRRLWLALTCLGAVGIGAAILISAQRYQVRCRDSTQGPGVPRGDNSDREPGGVRRRRRETRQRTRRAGHCAEAVLPWPQPIRRKLCLFQLPKVRMVRVPRAAGVGQQGNSAKSGVAAGPRSPSLDKETSEVKKVQRSVHRQNQRSTSARREARVADWTARGYAGGDYGRQGYSRNFW